MSLCKTCYALISTGSTRKRLDMTENILTGMLSINSNNRGPELLSSSVLDL